MKKEVFLLDRPDFYVGAELFHIGCMEYNGEVTISNPHVTFCMNNGNGTLWVQFDTGFKGNFHYTLVEINEEGGVYEE